METLLVLFYREVIAQVCVGINFLSSIKPLIFGLNQYIYIYCVYMYIVDIKMTLHIQVLVYCKKFSYPIDYGLTQNLCTLLYTANAIDNIC